MKYKLMENNKKSFTGLSYYYNNEKYYHSFGGYDNKKQIWLAKYIDEYKKLEEVLNKLDQKYKKYKITYNSLTDDLFRNIEWGESKAIERTFFYINKNPKFNSKIVDITFTKYNKNFSYTLWSSEDSILRKLQYNNVVLYGDNKKKYKKIQDKLEVIFNWSEKLKIIRERRYKLFYIFNLVLNEIVKYKIEKKELDIITEGMIDVSVNNRKYFISIKRNQFDFTKFDTNLEDDSNIYELNL